MKGDGSAVHGHRLSNVCRGGCPHYDMGRRVVADRGVGVRDGGGGRGRQSSDLLNVIHLVKHRLSVGVVKGDGSAVHGHRLSNVCRGGCPHYDMGRRVVADRGVGVRDGGGGRGRQSSDLLNVIHLVKHRLSVGDRDGAHAVQNWTADAGDAGEDLRRRDGEGCRAGKGEEEEDLERGALCDCDEDEKRRALTGLAMFRHQVIAVLTQVRLGWN